MSKEGSSNSKKRPRPAHYAPDPDDPDGPGIYVEAQPPKKRKRGEADKDKAPLLLHPEQRAAQRRAEDDREDDLEHAAKRRAVLQECVEQQLSHVRFAVAQEGDDLLPAQAGDRALRHQPARELGSS